MSKQKHNVPLEKNSDITLEITALSSEAQGIGRHEDFAVFVPGALPGETVDAHVIKVNSNYAVAKLTGIITPSDDRDEPKCPYFARCGGCDLQHMQYPAQLAFKRTRVRDALVKLAGMDSDTVDKLLTDTVGMDEPWRYRNKAAIPFTMENKAVRAGFFAPRSHRIIPIKDCLIQDEAAMTAMRAVCAWADEWHILTYDEEKNTGVLRHIVTRSTSAGDLLVTVVTTGVLEHGEELIKILRDNIPTLKGIVHNINSKQTNVIFGESFRTVWGKNAVTEDIMGSKFTVAAQSFMQVNHKQTEALYSLVVDSLNLSGTETVLDVYCGIGTITLLLAKGAKRVIGIESVQEAVTDARANAKINGVTNTEFICGEAERVMFMPEVEVAKPDCIVIDPPRKGCDEAVLRAIIKSGAKKLTYVSCNPETLARDLRVLMGGGFEVIKASPVDMFPGASHVETVVLMSKVQK